MRKKRDYRKESAQRRARNRYEPTVGALKRGTGAILEKKIGADAAARLAEIPADTRGLTARIFGDPLPGRSALARMQRGEA